jgi:multiple antibiotic resistance protein
MHSLPQSIVPLFVTLDPIGLLPMFVALTTGLSAAQRRRVAFEAVFAALAIIVGFMFLGTAIFHVLGISLDDFRIAGGILLLVLAVLDLLWPGKPAMDDAFLVGLVPLAMPLIAGPATLTTTLVLAQSPRIGYGTTTLALAINMAILLAGLLSADVISRLAGVRLLGALSKLVMVLLAAIAVNFIRTGIMDVVAQWKH